MPFLDLITTFIKNMFSLFIAPFIHYELLWIIIPVYLNWILTEIYQEKKGTSFGNAIANGFVALWVGIDWARITINILSAKGVKLTAVLPKTIPKLSAAALMGIYGFTIIILGMKSKRLVSYIGRIREVTYATITLTPLFYGVVQPTTSVLLSILIFFPVFYGIAELLLYLMPTPKTYDEEKKAESSFDFPPIKSQPQTAARSPTHYNPVIPDGPSRLQNQQFQHQFQKDNP